MQWLYVADKNVCAAIDEMVRRLRLNLGAKIDALNTSEGWTGFEAAPHPTDVAGDSGVDWAPLLIADAPVNRVLVGFPNAVTDAAAPATFTDTVPVTIYTLHNRVEISEQWRPILRRMSVIRGIFQHFITDCEDANGRKCWRILEPAGWTPLPGSYQNLAGIGIHYTLTLTPEKSLYVASANL